MRSLQERSASRSGRFNRGGTGSSSEPAAVWLSSVSGPAARRYSEPGDVILAVNNEQVTSVDQLRRLVEHPKGNVALLVQRDDQRIYIPIKLG